MTLRPGASKLAWLAWPPWLTTLAVLLAVRVVGPVVSAFDQGPALHISAPTEGTYASGATRLVAVIDPAARTRDVRQVTFFADGRQVCVVSKPPFQCDWDAGERLVEHQIRAVGLLASGDRLVDTVRTQGLQYAEGVDVDVVQVTAVVTDGGRFVRGLQQRDFKVFEDDRAQPITSFSSENIPLELITAIDVSSSMTDALPMVKESAKRFLAGLQPADQVTVLGFNDNIFTLARRATDQDARVRAIERLAPWGGTALYDVTIKAIDLLGRQQGRRSIVLFSDGDDQSSHAPIEAAIARTEGSDATIYAIGQGRAVRASNLQDLLRRFATVSGGRAFFSDDIIKLGTVFDEILEDLRNQYLLSYPAPSTRRDGAWHQIRVEVAGGKYHVRARQGYRMTPRQ
jgi:Ca-activated chloride channel family protein